MKKKLIMACTVLLFLSACTKKEEETIVIDDKKEDEKTIQVEQISYIPEADFQNVFTFPDNYGYLDDTLLMNSCGSFEGYEGQGLLYLDIGSNVESFTFYINDKRIEEEFESGRHYRLQISGYTVNGINTVFIGNIEPQGLKEAIKVYVTYPEVIMGTYEESSLSYKSLELVEDIIESDVEYGFPSASLAVIKNGKLIYENAWGKLNTADSESGKVDTSTMYDLASVTKMFSVNYALQKMLSEGLISLDDHISDYLGDRFYEDTIYIGYNNAPYISLDTQRRWKASLTIRDLLKHEGGFPADPRYFDMNADFGDYSQDEDGVYVLYTGNDHSLETREKTLEAICRTPLMYEPGSKTLYSDADYMILGFVVEAVSEQDLDTYLKENFFKPLDLKRISYVPLEKGYEKDDFAATEHYGNTRDHNYSFEGIRDYTLQGEVHDEKAWYSMAGISGHAGLFASASDLARLAYLMINGGYGSHKFFSPAVIELFTSPKDEINDNWGLGWYREGDDRRVWYFSSLADSSTIGHQGWTGTLVMVDRSQDLVIVYLTSQINSVCIEDDGITFAGRKYTAATLGFVSQMLLMNMDEEERKDIARDITDQAIRMYRESGKNDQNHPLYLNALSKINVLKNYLSEEEIAVYKERLDQ